MLFTINILFLRLLQWDKIVSGSLNEISFEFWLLLIVEYTVK
jgi:hypothetical protein